jgi:hypothetical protein
VPGADEAPRGISPPRRARWRGDAATGLRRTLTASSRRSNSTKPNWPLIVTSRIFPHLRSARGFAAGACHDINLLRSGTGLGDKQHEPPREMAGTGRGRDPVRGGAVTAQTRTRGRIRARARRGSRRTGACPTCLRYDYLFIFCFPFVHRDFVRPFRHVLPII